MGRSRAYIRVSTDMQLEYSPDSQIRLIREFAKNRGDTITDEDIYQELGVSGKKADKRPEFQKMIRDANNGDFDTLYIYHSSRFARNNEESAIYRAMLKRKNVEVISITQPSIDPKTDLIVNALNAAMDEIYIWDLSANVTRGMTQKAMSGGYQCSPPFGYKIPSPKQPPAVVEEEAKIVQLIFNTYLSGETSIWNIAKKLNDMGLRTRRGNLWERRTIEYMLINPMYKGMTVWNKRNNNKKFNNPEEWIIRQGTHTPIIEPEIFDKVQDIYKANRTTKNSKPPGTYKHWLSTVLKCPHCGSSLTFNFRKDDTHSTFSCNKYKKGKCNHSNSINQRKAEEAILKMISDIANNQVDIPLDRIIVKQSFNEIDALKKQLKNVDDSIKRYKAAFGAGIDTLEEYGENKKNALNEKAAIEKRIQSLEKDRSKEAAVPHIVNKAGEVYKLISNENIDIAKRNDIMKSLFNKIIYYKESYEFHAYFNF